MHRFFVTPDQIEGEHITIEGEDFKHITKVLRIGDKETLEICDGQGTDHLARVDAVDKASLSCSILESHNSLGENRKTKITLFQGLPKGQKMESIIQKSVETGVFSIVPFSSKRTVVQLGDKKDKKTQRWQRIAYEAAKQSKRGKVPIVQEPVNVGGIAKILDRYDLVLMAYEGETGKNLKNVLLSLEFDPASIAIIIGPEGGFAKEEVKIMEEAGAYAVSLGKRILRTETAGVVLLSQLNFFYEG